MCIHLYMHMHICIYADMYVYIRSMQIYLITVHATCIISYHFLPKSRMAMRTTSQHGSNLSVCVCVCACISVCRWPLPRTSGWCGNLKESVHWNREFKYIYMYIYVHIHMYTYMRIYIYIHMCVYICIYIFI